MKKLLITLVLTLLFTFPISAEVICWDYDNPPEDLAGFTLTINGTTLPNFDPNCRQKDLGSLEEGSFHFELVAFDTSGLISDPPATLDYTVDHTAPDAATNLKIVKVDSEFVLRWDHIGAVDLSKFEIVMTSPSGEQTIPITDISVREHSFRVLPDGKYDLEILSYDTFGNVSTSRTLSYTIDTTPPSKPSNFRIPCI